MVKKEVVRLVGMMEISTKKDENVGKSQFVKRQMKENKNKRTWLDRQIDRQIDEKKRRDREKKQTDRDGVDLECGYVQICAKT